MAKRTDSTPALDVSHLRELRPMKVSRDGRHERFIVPEIRELTGTAFALCPDEVQFVTTMIDDHRRQGLRKHNVVLFRADQRKFCGDFVCVDVSSPPRRRGELCLPAWDVFVIDLKRGAPLQVNGGGAGVQFKNAALAADLAHRALAERHVGPDQATRRAWQRGLEPADVWTLVGDRDIILTFFEHLRLVRRHRRKHGGDRQAAIRIVEQVVARREKIVWV